MEFDRKTLAQMHATALRYHHNLSAETVEYLGRRGIGADLIQEWMLGTCDDIHAGWLSIPYLRGYDSVAWIKYRRLDDGKPKYLGSGHPHLFNTAALDTADQTGALAVCEGEIDAITATSLFGVPAVGIPGATQWTGNKHWRHLFTGYQKVWVLADPDEAGLSLASAILDDLPAARLVKLPADVNDCWVLEADIREMVK
jgi:DNA primase